MGGPWEFPGAKAVVVGVCPFTDGRPSFHKAAHLRLLRFPICSRLRPLNKFLTPGRLGGVSGCKGKGNPFYLDLYFFAEFLNTPSTGKKPGSNVARKGFKVVVSAIFGSFYSLSPSGTQRGLRLDALLEQPADHHGFAILIFFDPISQIVCFFFSSIFSASRTFCP
ncbi:MAG: hypothetical protein CM15mP75_0120 [Flammeovirgaceae bacterium]|nr:MAG: hypothetical protein CM15mP75_0120 [Flammeovirgaceae bacterium]